MDVFNSTSFPFLGHRKWDALVVVTNVHLQFTAPQSPFREGLEVSLAAAAGIIITQLGCQLVEPSTAGWLLEARVSVWRSHQTAGAGPGHRWDNKLICIANCIMLLNHSNAVHRSFVIKHFMLFKMLTKYMYVESIVNSTSDFYSTFDIAISHNSEVIISTLASQITGVSIVYSTVCSGADQRKHQSSASLVFVRGIHWWIPRPEGQ